MSSIKLADVYISRAPLYNTLYPRLPCKSGTPGRRARWQVTGCPWQDRRGRTHSSHCQVSLASRHLGLLVTVSSAADVNMGNTGRRRGERKDRQCLLEASTPRHHLDWHYTTSPLHNVTTQWTTLWSLQSQLGSTSNNKELIFIVLRTPFTLVSFYSISEMWTENVRHLNSVFCLLRLFPIIFWWLSALRLDDENHFSYAIMISIIGQYSLWTLHFWL